MLIRKPLLGFIQNQRLCKLHFFNFIVLGIRLYLWKQNDLIINVAEILKDIASENSNSSCIGYIWAYACVCDIYLSMDNCLNSTEQPSIFLKSFCFYNLFSTTATL